MQKAAAITARVRDWTFNAALPFWAERAGDQRFGGFIEELNFDGGDAGRPFKRTRVAGRQMYVFSHAHVLGHSEGFAHIARGADYLIAKAWMGEDKGFARTLTRDGAVADATADLYDHAFVLFGFSWAYRATGDKAYADWAHKTLDFVERRLAHPGGEGFLGELPAAGFRRQNPHMHLLEASLAAYEATGDRRFGERAYDLAALFSRRFFDARNGTLGEYFLENWTRAPGDEGRIVEPGHQLEWVWILDNCGRLLGLEFPEEMRALAAFAEKRGVDPVSHAVHLSVRTDGAVIDATSRTWSNAERLKAAVALFERDGKDAAEVIAQSAGLLLDRYFSSAPGISLPAGAWIDAFDGKGAPLSKTVPASTLYHVFLAFAEVMRVANTTAG